MTCPGDGSTGPQQASWLFRNWARTRSIVVPLRTRPTTLEQVVAGVTAAEDAGGVLKAMGSGWSYSDAAVTADVTRVMDTSSLSRVLTGTDPESRDTLLPFALNDRTRPLREFHVHVEAGIKIHALNCALDGLRLAMPTLGGSSGQSLAGAIGTGTHGADVDLPPIVDAVRAIHLVGPGGQEWWIEPDEDQSITDRERMREAQAEGLLCEDIRIEYDSELFGAVLVSLGRMGVIYSVVIEAVSAFRLREVRREEQWSATAAWLRSDVIDATSYSGPRAIEVVVSPYRNAAGDNDAIVTVRSDTTAPLSPEVPPNPDPFQILCDFQSIKPLLATIAIVLPGLIATATAAAIASIAWVAGIPFVGGLIFGVLLPGVIAAATGTLVALQTALIGLIASSGDNLAQKLAEVVNLAVRAGQRQLVPDLINMIIRTIRDPNATPVVRESFRIMTSQLRCPQWQDSPTCMREIDGLEFALNASRGRRDLFQFMDAVFALTSEYYNSNRPPGFAMSLRFSRRTAAKLGMQQFDRTCSVEFIMLRGFRGHNAFVERLYRIARQYDAIPHWGLINNLSAADVESLYGSKLTEWRTQLGRLLAAGGRRTTFSTSFSRQRQLEPLFGCAIPASLLRALLALAAARARGRDMGRRGDASRG